MSNLPVVKAEYENLVVTFTEEGWFNATAVAERFGKNPYEWLRLPETKKYIAALKSTYGKIPYVKSSRTRADRGGGTWLHPKLAVAFARWLDVRFAVWCDMQIDSIIKGTHKHYDWKRIRHEATSSFKVMNAVLQLQRQMQGKPCAPHHFSNESRLINWALTGEFKGIDRNTLSHGDLDMLAKLEERNTVLMGVGLSYGERKHALEIFIADYRKLHTLALVGCAE
jgi:hypothetical protein